MQTPAPDQPAAIPLAEAGTFLEDLVEAAELAWRCIIGFQDGSKRALNGPENQWSIGFQPVFGRTERCFPTQGILIILAPLDPSGRTVHFEVS